MICQCRPAGTWAGLSPLPDWLDIRCTGVVVSLVHLTLTSKTHWKLALLWAHYLFHIYLLRLHIIKYVVKLVQYLYWQITYLYKYTLLLLKAPPLVICFGNYWHLLMSPSKAKGPVTFVWRWIPRYSSNIIVCVAEIKLHMESFWAAPDPPMALSADWPTSYTLFLGNRIKIQARCVHFLRTIDSITPKCWDLQYFFDKMPYFLEILLSQHNCTVRKEDIVLCKLLITLIIILTITLTTSTSTPIKVTFSEGPSLLTLWWFIYSLTSGRNNSSVDSINSVCYGSVSGS